MRSAVVNVHYVRTSVAFIAIIIFEVLFALTNTHRTIQMINDAKALYRLIRYVR